MDMRISRNRGFTLIELLVVIAIIGILAAIVLVSVNASRQKATNVKAQAELMQLRTQLELNYANGAYVDLTGDSSHAATVTTGSSGEENITLLACEIGDLNGYPSTVSGNLVVTCGGVPGLNSGVVIYSNSTGASVTDYGVYATTTPGGYVCVDSYGNTVSTTTGNIPDWLSIVSPTTALCQ